MNKFLLALGVIGSIGLVQADLLDDFDGSTLGNPHGITYTNTPNGQGVVFSRRTESRIQYDFQNVIPTEGTLEFLIKVDAGYNYSNYDLHEDNDRALIFTTDVQGGDVTWPGSTWLYVYKNGTIRLHIAGEKYESGWDQKYILDAEETSFRFGEWHSIAISFGSEGRYIRLDGEIVASNIGQTQPLGRGGLHSTPMDTPTIGESVSAFWSNNQHEGGFEGVLNTFRISESQKDWNLLVEEPETPVAILSENLDIHIPVLHYQVNESETQNLEIFLSPAPSQEGVLTWQLDSFNSAICAKTENSCLSSQGAIASSSEISTKTPPFDIYIPKIRFNSNLYSSNLGFIGNKNGNLSWQLQNYTELGKVTDTAPSPSPKPNTHDVVYMTDEAENSSEYNYMITLKTIGKTFDTGHAWVEFNNRRNKADNTTLGFYPEGDKILLSTDRAEIHEEFGGHDDSLRINVTKEQFKNALLVANYFKDECLFLNSQNKCTRWKTINSYSLTPYNKFVCTSYANAILQAADIPVPNLNFTNAKLYFQGVITKLGI